MGLLHVAGASPAKIMCGGQPATRVYFGVELVWSSVQSPFEGPKIDPQHNLANRATMKRLTLGALEGMTADANYAVTDSAFASKTAGTLTFVKEPLPATSPTTLRVSALIKVDKTAGRYSRVGYVPNNLNPTSTSPDVWIGHTAGSGIQVSGQVGGTVSASFEVIPEAKLVDGAWYRVSLIWDSVFHQDTSATNAGRNRVMGAAEPVDPVNTPAAPWYVMPDAGARSNLIYVPQTLTAKTNSALGTIRDLAYVDSMLGVNDDNAPIYSSTLESTTAGDRMWLWSKGKSAPARVIITAGGSGLYGGGSWANGLGRSGQPYDQWRATWRQLANLGYTVMHTNALHEGWGADDHLTKQIGALNRLKAEFGDDVRVYYLAYSMGGLSAWRAVRGRAGYPTIRAAYIIGGAIGLDRYYDMPAYSQIKTRWPNRAALDAPEHLAGADLIARGTRVRCVTSLADTNVPKADNHDVMKAKYGGSPLFSELVHTTYNHFDPGYWDATDMVAFFEGQDT